jgi:transposase
LEFNYILKALDEIEEAIRDFDKDRGVIALEEKMNGKPADTEKELDISEETKETKDEQVGIEESVETIALEHPGWGSSKIVKELNTEKYGFIRISSLAVRKILKQLNLKSKKQREEAQEQRKSND